MKVDLNSDLGESFGAYTIGMDKEVIPLVTSANIACGFHAGESGGHAENHCPCPRKPDWIRGSSRLSRPCRLRP